MPEENEKIWILGGKVSSADKNIPWQENIPNLSNSDRLIIDLVSIPPKVAIPRYEIRDYLRYMMMAKKTIYVILSPTSAEDRDLRDILPVFPNLNKVKPCNFELTYQLALDIATIPDEIEEYGKYVENCPFFIDGVISGYLWECLNPLSSWHPEKYSFSDRIEAIAIKEDFEMINAACQSIGLAVKYRILGKNRKCLWETGQVIFLPPPTKISSTEAIEVLVNSLVGMKLKEDEPDWASKVKMPKVEELEKQISKEKKTIAEANEKIRQLTHEKTEMEKHKKLLWTYDKPLEYAVRDAFILLGFTEIRAGRSKELEDWVIDFKTTKEYVHGVMEVKGSEKRTSMENMNQCHKWVNQYRVKEKEKVLGIFLPNQFRREELPDSKKRLHFEPNEIEFAKDFKICVLPTVELFNAVKYVLQGDKLPREEIEKRILEADPICKLI